MCTRNNTFLKICLITMACFIKKKPQLCIDISQRGRENTIVTAYGCHGYGNQYFELNSKGELHLEFIPEMCLAYKNDKFDLIDCFDKTQALGKHAKWKYLKGDLMQNVESGLCMNFEADAKVKIVECNSKSIRQQWVFTAK